MPSPADALNAIFAADRALRAQEKALLEAPPAAASALLCEAVGEATRLTDRKEAVMRLERLADLCAQVEGPAMVDQLIAILDDDAPSVRVQAAEALVDVGFERYAEVARGIERALEQGRQDTALKELPWVLVEIAEPSARPLIARFLQHRDVEVVASAVEALAELGDPAAAKDLRPLQSDPRPVELDEDDGEITATLGDLVSEALAALGEEPAR
jgi:HEAT repeat protein